MTPIEAAVAASELADRLAIVARLDAYATTHAAELAMHRAEAYSIATELGLHLVWDVA